MDSIVYSPVGLIHLIFSILAMIFGAWVIFNRKGSKRHKQVGYAYAISMIGVIVTAFMIYRLFKGWGIFHYMAVVSSVTLILGMLPAMLRKPKDNWAGLHIGFMYWSVVGLYAAFISEVLTRAPWSNMKLFLVILMSFFALCSFLFNRNMKRWTAQFS